MAKVVGISGAQGGGKSTLIKALAEKGWSMDTFRVSRAVQAELGWESLDRVMDDVETMKRFQDEVLRQKYDRDWGLRTHDPRSLILTERTFADIAAYTSRWTWEHVGRGNWDLDVAAVWLTGYISRCTLSQADCYDGVVLLPYMDAVEWEHDPNRADRGSATLIYEDIVRFTEKSRFLRQPRFTVTAAAIEDRVTEVDTFLRTL